MTDPTTLPELADRYRTNADAWAARAAECRGVPTAGWLAMATRHEGHAADWRALAELVEAADVVARLMAPTSADRYAAAADRLAGTLTVEVDDDR